MSWVADSAIKAITYMNTAGAKGPIVALEATVTGGRTIQAHKRGGKDEARERLIEESTGAVVWLWGVSVLNKLGDKILGHYLGGNFDVGTDKVLRTPFENFMKKNPPKNLSKKQVAMIKASKVLASVLIADAFIGLVVPPLNQKLTRKLREKNANKENVNIETQDKLELSTKEKEKTKSPSFKGGASVAALNVFTNAIENSNVGQLLSTDAGLVTGRMYSARNNDERREIAIRDIGSIYFYMWAQGHMRNLLNLVETGKADRLNPETAQQLDKKLVGLLESNGGEMTLEEFRTRVLGKKVTEINLPEGINFESGELSSFNKFMNRFRKVKAEPLQVAKVSELESLFTDKAILNRIREMAKLQPLRQGEAVITKQQIIDAINVAEINDPKFLDEVFSTFTGGASKDEFKYVSNKKLYNLKDLMIDYVETICGKAKDGKVTKDLLSKARKQNIAFNGINFVLGFVFAATFLSTLIPKFQYYVTKKVTGKDYFPGLDDEKAKNKTA